MMCNIASRCVNKSELNKINRHSFIKGWTKKPRFAFASINSIFRKILFETEIKEGGLLRSFSLKGNRQ